MAVCCFMSNWNGHQGYGYQENAQNHEMIQIKLLVNECGFSSPARYRRYGIHIYRPCPRWYSLAVTCKLATTSLSACGPSPLSALALSKVISLKDKISLAAGGVLLQTCPCLPYRRPLSDIHLSGAHQVDISPIHYTPALWPR